MSSERSLIPENCWICNYCDKLYDCDNNFDENNVQECIQNKTNKIAGGKRV